MVFAVGERIEFTGATFGFTKAIYAGRIISIGAGTMNVANEEAIGPDGYPSVEVVAIERARPFSGAISDSYSFRRYYGCMAIGYVVDWGVRRKEIVRKHQDCIIGVNVSYWRYCDRIWPTFSVGTRVEVIGLRRNYVNAFLGGKIRRLREGGVDVQYDSIKTDNGRRFVGFVPYRSIRPYPLSWVANYRPGDAVDAWDGYAWWPGICIRMEQGRFIICFNHGGDLGREVVCDKPNMRRNQTWSIIDGWSCWMYSRAG
ncbi:hypothetical protein LXL04_037352 [Taraxacum kok-saghyz]